MGLTIIDGIQDFLKESKKCDFSDKSLLMLGKQHVYMNLSQFYFLAGKLGIHLYDNGLDYNFDDDTVDSYLFFKLLGFQEVHAMDISDYEGADIVFDLNQRKLPEDLTGKFDYIVDGGTLEHVFDIPQALKNIAQMLKTGGKVYHYLPAAGWINHGYYSLSPSLFQDFYQKNNFDVEDINLTLFSNAYNEKMCNNIFPESLEDCLCTALDYRMINLQDGIFNLLHDYKCNVRCIAVKRDVSSNAVPIQRHWYDKGLNEDIFIKILNIDNYDKNSIVIYGAGYVADRFYKILEKYEAIPDKVVGFCVTEAKSETFHEKPVMGLKKAVDLGIKAVIIASTDYEDEIYSSIEWVKERGIRIIRLKKHAFWFK